MTTTDPNALALVPASRRSEATHVPTVSPFSGGEAFEAAQRMARALATSNLVPEIYRGEGRIGDALIALELSHRLGASVLMVMQNMNVIQGRPSWSATFLIAAVNSSGKFSPVRYKMRAIGPKEVAYTYWEGFKPNRVKKDGKLRIEDRGCIAWAKDLATGEIVEGPEVTLEMSVLEGWYTRNDSKWKTMPEVMLRYRSAAFFSRLYAPEITMGMQTQDEVEDARGFIDVETVPTEPIPRRGTTPAKVTDVATVDAGTPPEPAKTEAPAGLKRREKAPHAQPETPAPPAPPMAPPAPSAPAIEAQVATPAAVAPAPTPAKQRIGVRVEKEHHKRLKVWLGQNEISPAEILMAIHEYGRMDDAPTPQMTVDHLNEEQVAFVMDNGPAIAEAIKGQRGA